MVYLPGTRKRSYFFRLKDLIQLYVTTEDNHMKPVLINFIIFGTLSVYPAFPAIKIEGFWTFGVCVVSVCVCECV